MLEGNPDAGVAHANPHTRSLALGKDRDASFRGRIAERILHEIGDDLSNRCGIGGRGGRIG
jgi:hypothetical protein